MDPSVTFSKKGIMFGTVHFGDKPHAVFSAHADENFKTLVEQCIREGVPSVIHHHKDTALIAVFKNTLPNEKNFEFEFMKHLEANGYDAYEKHKELEQDIEALLRCLSGGEKVKDDIIKHFPEMNYLEKTYIKNELENTLARLAEKNAISKSRQK